MAYSLVGSVNVPGGANGGTSGSLDTTGATLLVAQVASYAGSAAPAFSDSKGNTWSALTTYASAEDPRTIIYYVVNPTVGTGHTFTTSGASSYCVAGIEAWSGGDTTSPFDVENGNALTGSHTTIQPGSVTPSQNGSLIVSSFGGDRFASSISIDSGFTTTEVDNGVGGTNIGGALAYLVQGSAAAINPTWSYAASTYGAAAAIAVFKPAAAAATIYWGYGDPEQFPARRHLTSIVRLEDAIWPSTVVATPSQFGYNVEPQFPVRQRRNPRSPQFYDVAAPPTAATPTQQGFSWEPSFPLRRHFQPTRQEQPEVYPTTAVATPTILGWEVPTFQWIRRKFHLFQGDPEFAPNEPPPAPPVSLNVIRATILRVGALLRRHN